MRTFQNLPRVFFCIGITLIVYSIFSFGRAELPVLVPWVMLLSSVGIVTGSVWLAFTESTLVSPPGSKLMVVARIFLNAKTVDRECASALADWHEEYFKALDSNAPDVQIYAINVRHTFAFLKAAGLLGIFRLIGKLLEKLAGSGKG